VPDPVLPVVWAAAQEQRPEQLVGWEVAQVPAVWAAAQEQPPERLVGWEVVLGVALVLHLV
jgi:hypothetical protein